MQQPLPGLAKSEDKIIEETILRPVWAEVERLTGSDHEPFKCHVGAGWGGPLKRLVPLLRSEETRMAHLRHIFEVLVAERYRKRDDMLRLVRQHPHYFWYVPGVLYRRGLLDHGSRNLDVVHALIEVAQSTHLWESSDKRVLIKDLKDRLSVTSEHTLPNSVIYKEHRFVGTGQDSINTHDVLTMFVILGREAWLHSASEVALLSAELAQGGDELRAKWVSEVRGWDPEWVDRSDLSQPHPRRHEDNVPYQGDEQHVTE